jgi:hypothetical protein
VRSVPVVLMLVQVDLRLMLVPVLVVADKNKQFKNWQWHCKNLASAQKN